MSPTFTRVAVVNRGESAVRFLRALRDYNGERGTAIEAVALYTDPDRLTPFVRLADHAVGIGPALIQTPTGMLSAYLDHDRVIAAIVESGCDAVWPGWGFVAEDAAFVERLEAAGITFIGPSSAAMRRLGDKIAAKRIAEEAAVPMAPWHLIAPGEAPDVTRAAAERIGFPLVVKASAGGGGRGIRVVRRAEDLAAAVHSVKEEVARSFNAGGLFMEACVTAARHIEVQLVVDAAGRGQTLGIRDCSIQRRHQKVIEEAPSPAVNGGLQARLEAAAVRLGEAVGYRGVGTVEFLVDPTRDFAHFLEVNTRLQVEHTITECVTGLDLVHIQLDVARGLPIPSAPAKPHGHAIEVRLNAEDPERGFQPAPGVVRVFRPSLGPGIRVDSGVAEGVAIAPQFDSMIAKLIAWGKDRTQAIARMGRALRELELVVEDGATNKAFLSELLADPTYLDASADTGWLDRRSADARRAPVPGGFEALCVAAILLRERAIEDAVRGFMVDVQGGIPYRLDAAATPVELSLRGTTATFEAHAIGPRGSDRWAVGPTGDVLREARLEATGAGSAVLHLHHATGWVRHAVLHSTGRSGMSVEIDGRAHLIEPASGGKVRAPAPALVVSVQVKDGDVVTAGQRLLTLEAMKMEVPVTAPEAGVVKGILCRPNEQVAAGQTLVLLEASADQQTGRSDRDEPGLMIPPAPAPTLTVAAVIDVVRRRLVGGDVAAGLLERAEQILAREDDFRTTPEPELWRPLAELVFAFVDLELVFQSEAAFFAACRRGALDPELAPRLLRAVAHHGVTSLDRATSGAAGLDEALWRLAAARTDAPRRHRLVNAVLRALIALSDNGLRFDDQRELEVMLSRVAEVARADLPFVRDNARQARYLLFRRARMNGPAPAPSLGQQLGRGDAAAIIRAAYGDDAVIRPLASPLGLDGYAIIGFAGARSLALVVSGALAGTAIAAAQPLVDELASGGRCEVHVFLAGLVEDELAVRARGALASLDLSAVTRVALSSTSDGQREQHRSLVPQSAGGATVLTDERWLDDVHPERARRLELWRLDGFTLERLPAPDPILAFKARARGNAKDERIVVFAELTRAPRLVQGASDGDGADDPGQREVDWTFAECLRVIREAQTQRQAAQRYFLNRIVLHVAPVLEASPAALSAIARRFEGPTRGLGIQKVVVQARVLRDGEVARRIFSFAMRGRHRLEVHETVPSCAPIRAASDYHVRVELARRLGAVYPYEIIRALEGSPGADAALTAHPDMMHGRFVELDLDATGAQLAPVDRPPGQNQATVVVGLVTHATRKHPEGMTRVFVASDPTTAMGALAEPECRRIVAALDLAAGLKVPLEWLPISSGARIAMDSGTENLDWTARVLRKIVEHTQQGHEVNIIVSGVNVGAQSYWNAMATMLMHTRGLLVMTGDGSMVLTGKKALEVSGSVAAEDERGIGGYERIMGPNGEAQVFARSLGDAYRILFEHYAHTYVAAGEKRPRRLPTTDPTSRSVLAGPLAALFSEVENPGRKKPFAVRDVMRATIDADAGYLERYGAMEGGETAVIWDAHLGGHPATVIGFESQVVARKDKAPLDGPESWNGGTLFPQSSKKVARAINQASGNRPVVVLANLSGFDGSPESMRRWQLEHGAEIGRAVVNFAGPIVFVVIGRYHGGAYVVFSKALNPSLTAMAVEGSYASVIGGAPAAAVVFPREVRRRAANDPRVRAAQQRLGAAVDGPDAERLRAELDKFLSEAVLEHQGVVAREFDAIHTVERAVAVGSLDAVIAPARLRPAIIEVLDKAAAQPRATIDDRPLAIDGGTPAMA